MNTSRIGLFKWREYSFENWNNIFISASKDDIILINFLPLKFRYINCLDTNWSLKQLSKVYFRRRSEECLFGNFSAQDLRWIPFWVTFHAFSISLWTPLDWSVWVMKIIHCFREVAKIWDMKVFICKRYFSHECFVFLGFIKKPYYKNTFKMKDASSI